jgi:hypothetical protein
MRARPHHKHGEAVGEQGGRVLGNRLPVQIENPKCRAFGFLGGDFAEVSSIDELLNAIVDLARKNPLLRSSTASSGRRSGNWKRTPISNKPARIRTSSCPATSLLFRRFASRKSPVTPTRGIGCS